MQTKYPKGYHVDYASRDYISIKSHDFVSTGAPGYLEPLPTTDQRKPIYSRLSSFEIVVLSPYFSSDSSRASSTAPLRSEDHRVTTY